MMTAERLETRLDAVKARMERRLRLRAGGMDEMLRRARGRLPGWIRREFERIAAAERAAGHPKLSMQVDHAALDRAFVRCERWLRGADPGSARRDRWLGALAQAAFNLLLVAAAFAAYLVWAGHI